MTEILLFASLREIAGASRVSCDGATVGEVLDRLGERYGREFTRIASLGSVVVDGQTSRRDRALTGAEEVALLPPVSGG